MIDARRVRHGRGSETCSVAGDCDVSGGGGGEAPILASDGPVDDFDVQFIQVQREVAFEEMKARLKKLKAEDESTSAGATGAAGATPVAAAAPVPSAPVQGPRGRYKKVRELGNVTISLNFHGYFESLVLYRGRRKMRSTNIDVSLFLFFKLSTQAVRTSTVVEQDGVRLMVEAIGMAYQRAKARGPADCVNHYMSLPRNYSSRLSLVRFLQKNDKEYQPGEWFIESGLIDVANPSTINKGFDSVQRDVDGFEWVSWHDM